MEIKTIAIVGAGEHGRKIARAAVLAGYRTILEDISRDAVEQGIGWIARALDERVSADEMASEPGERALAQLTAAHSAEEASREADLIIECVSDEQEMKLELFTIFDKFAKPGAIFASTTNSLSISELAEMTVWPERCIGMRWAADGGGAGGLELVRGRLTSQETLDRCCELGRRMKLSVQIVHDEQTLSASGD
jgi:3-hydroxybutyryl-CoA dehydrogenase